MDKKRLLIDPKVHSLVQKKRDYSGVRYFNLDGEYHRDGGPAIVTVLGSWQWYQNGELNCLTGPAIKYSLVRDIRSPDSATYYYYIDGEILSFSEFAEHPLVTEETVEEMIVQCMNFI